MNKLLIFILSVCSVTACKAQEDVPPPNEKIEYITNKGIEYKFPYNIEQALNNKISKDEKVSHYIDFSIINDSTYTLVLQCSKNVKKGLESTNLIFKKTGRYYQYKTKEVPIIFDTDYIFSFPGFVFPGYCLRITFVYNKNWRDNKNAHILQEENNE